MHEVLGAATTHDTVFAIVLKAYNAHFPFFYREKQFWRDHFEYMARNSDDPETASDLAESLWREGEEEGRELARDLIFENTEHPRWPDSELVCELAAEMLSEEENFAAVVDLLRDPEGGHRWPDNETIRLLFARALSKLKIHDEVEAVFLEGNEEEIYQKPQLLKIRVSALLELHKDNELHALFSGENKAYRKYFSAELVFSILRLLHKSKRFDLMHAVIWEAFHIDASLESNPDFLAYATRVLNNLGKWRETILLLTESQNPMVPNFSTHAECMKNLAYAFVKLNLPQEARLTVHAGQKAGIPKSTFAHVRKEVRRVSACP